MPRMDGIDISTFPAGSDIVTLNGNIITKIEELSEDITNLTNVQEIANVELSRIRLANEIIIYENLADDETNE